MIGNRMHAFVLSAALATVCFAAPAIASPYDGSWKMQLVTTNGHCGVINIDMAVDGGHITATGGRFVSHKIYLAGRIWGGGTTKINGVAGPRQAQGVGRFTPAKGSGKWNGTGPSGVCSGYWVADRG